MRSSVLRLWAAQAAVTSADDLRDMVRFNEAIDQALTESMARYAKMLREAQNLFRAILGHVGRARKEGQYPAPGQHRRHRCRGGDAGGGFKALGARRQRA